MEKAVIPAGAPKPGITTRLLEGFCTLFGVLGCLTLALNLPFSPAGWIFGTLSAALGIPWAMRVGAPMMMAMQSVFLVLDLIGVYRNFIPYLKTVMA